MHHEKRVQNPYVTRSPQTSAIRLRDSPRNAIEIVREFMERDPVIRIGLARGLINVRALARYFQVETNEGVTFEALVSAIRRYPIKDTLYRSQEMGRLISKIGMKNKIIEVAIRNDPEVPTLLARFSGEVDYGRGDTLSIVSSAHEVIVVADSSNLDKLLEKIPKRNIMSIDHELATVIVSYNTPVVGTPGLLAAICTEMAIEGISIRDLIETLSDSTFLVREDDALKALQAVKRLANQR